MTKLFVGGLPYSVTSDELKDMFTKFGNVASATVITDKYSGQSKGFGFVEMENDSEAQEAIKALDGSDLNGRKVGVSVARPREERPERSSGGYNQGGFNRDRDSGFHGGFNRSGRGNSSGKRR